MKKFVSKLVKEDSTAQVDEVSEGVEQAEGRAAATHITTGSHAAAVLEQRAAAAKSGIQR